MGLPRNAPTRLPPFVRVTIAAVLFVLVTASLLTLHRHSPMRITITASTISSSADGSGHSSVASPLSSDSSPPPLPDHRYAYAAFLAASEDPNNSDDDADNYFVGTRILTYQLLHAEATRTRSGIPFLVLCTADVSASKRARLAADGATIVPVEVIHVPWIVAGRERWKDVLTKLRLWQLTQYERILFLDSDVLLTRSMDAIFADSAATIVPTHNTTHPPGDEGPPPAQYVIAGVSGQGSAAHRWPPRAGREFNAGFVLLRPDTAMFEYYMRVAQIEGRFKPNYPEQALWNYVHRRDGNMPWAQLRVETNVNWASENDVKQGAWSLHAKWWHAEDAFVSAVGWRLRWEMEGAAEGRAETGWKELMAKDV